MDFPQGLVLADYTDTLFCSDQYPFWTENAAELGVVNFVAAAWPAANRVIYVPFTIDTTGIVQRMAWINSGVAGTSDLGVIDATTLQKMCSIGATTNAGTFQSATPAAAAGGSTTLTPGNYYAAMTVSTVTTATIQSAAAPIPNLAMHGVCQDANASSTIPTAPSLTRLTSLYLPLIGVGFTATV